MRPMSADVTGGLAEGVMVTPAIRLVRELGRGGMGSVWIADHIRLRTQVVVKFIAHEHLSSKEALDRFEREASLAAQAKSPHVVQVFDHGVSDTIGLPYIAMEYLEGEDLAARLSRDRFIEAKTFSTWLSQACRGMAKAHAKGIVHRDIKPENIFLCDNDGDILVKVLDFGIAKADAASGFTSTKTGAFMGTAYYMSPEQTMGLKTLDHRSDLWALGVVSFYALTGMRPFDGDAIGALVVAITQAPIPKPSTYNPRLTPAIDAWMEKALARDPAARFSNAREMGDAFEQALQNAGGRAPSITTEHLAQSGDFAPNSLGYGPSGAGSGPVGAISNDGRNDGRNTDAGRASYVGAPQQSLQNPQGYAPYQGQGQGAPPFMQNGTPFPRTMTPIDRTVGLTDSTLRGSVRPTTDPHESAPSIPGEKGKSKLPLVAGGLVLAGLLAFGVSRVAGSKGAGEPSARIQATEPPPPSVVLPAQGQESALPPLAASAFEANKTAAQGANQKRLDDKTAAPPVSSKKDPKAEAQKPEPPKTEPPKPEPKPEPKPDPEQPKPAPKTEKRGSLKDMSLQ